MIKAKIEIKENVIMPAYDITIITDKNIVAFQTKTYVQKSHEENVTNGFGRGGGLFGKKTVYDETSEQSKYRVLKETFDNEVIPALIKLEKIELKEAKLI